jgi:8-oxo-dGTP pyrophosphatase MutT (NUDIX family)
MKNIDVLWEGNLPLHYIKWDANNISKCSYFENFKVLADKNWNEHLKRYPNDYDGTLLFLEKFKFENGELNLEISLIKFSMANYLLKHNVPLKKGYGALGTQYLVFSPNRDYILIGERAMTQSYYPGAINVPGGILEMKDLGTNPTIALIRELREEVLIPLQSNFYLVAILGGWDNVSVTFLISAMINNKNKFNPNDTYESDNNEWEGNLRWLSLKKLERMSSPNFLDGLLYFQSILLEKSDKVNSKYYL